MSASQTQAFRLATRSYREQDHMSDSQELSDTEVEHLAAEPLAWKLSRVWNLALFHPFHQAQFARKIASVLAGNLLEFLLRSLLQWAVIHGLAHLPIFMYLFPEIIVYATLSISIGLIGNLESVYPSLWFCWWWDGRWLWNGLGLMRWKMGKAYPNWYIDSILIW